MRLIFNLLLEFFYTFFPLYHCDSELDFNDISSRGFGLSQQREIFYRFDLAFSCQAQRRTVFCSPRQAIQRFLKSWWYVQWESGRQREIPDHLVPSNFHMIAYRRAISQPPEYLRIPSRRVSSNWITLRLWPNWVSLFLMISDKWCFFLQNMSLYDPTSFGTTKMIKFRYILYTFQ